MSGPARQLTLTGEDDETTAVSYGPAAVPVTPIATSGRTEYTAHCPRCSAMHRHTRPGIRRGPCGATYTVPEYQGDDDTS